MGTANKIGMTPYECAETVQTRKLFPEYKKRLFMSKYQRHIIGNQVIKNGRSDHVQKLLLKVKSQKVKNITTQSTTDAEPKHQKKKQGKIPSSIANYETKLQNVLLDLKAKNSFNLGPDTVSYIFVVNGFLVNL